MSANPESLFSEAEMPQAQLAVVEASPAQLIREVIKSGLTSESVGVVERLVALAERQEQRQAEKAFNAAMARLQPQPDSSVLVTGGLYGYC